MSRKAQFLRWFVPAALVFIVGMGVATVWDLPINQAVYSPANPFGMFMEFFGWYPAFIPAIMLAILYIVRPKGLRRAAWEPIAGAAVLAGGVGVLAYMSVHYMEKRGMVTSLTDWRALAVAGCVAALAACGFFTLKQCKGNVWEKIMFFGWCGSIYMVANQAVVYTIKTIWQRTRFDDMVASGSFADFTCWFQPFGNGGNSFPSGHTANACGIFVLIILCDLFPKWNSKRKLVYAFCWAYVALMAGARIWVGRHFLSDTLMATAILATIFYVLRSSDFYRKGLRRLKAQEDAHAV